MARRLADFGGLFSSAESKTWNTKATALHKKLDERDPKITKFDHFWSQIQALEQAYKVEMVRRAQQRATEYLNALLILVGSRGTEFIPFEEAFSETEKHQKLLIKYNTPEARRALYTIFRSMTEIPKSWACSAFLRFLRGTGKQKDAKYHGAGTFGVRYGWKEDEVKAICNVMADGHNPYSHVLMSYANLYDEIKEAERTNQDNPDYTEVPYGTEFYATRVERDKEFLNKLCEMLEKQGLADIPVPADEKPKKDRKPKQFKPGDIIRKATIRDLPLPAHIRFQIERQDEKTKQWVEASMEHVVIALGNYADYKCAIVPPGSKIAHPYWRGSKLDLDGATYLGPWTGKIATKEMRITFFYRRKSK